MNKTTLTGERNEFILRSNQANLALMRTPKASLVNQVGNYSNPSTKFQIANQARKAQLEHGIATDPAALGSANLFALSALTIPTLADPRIDSEISLIAGVAKAQSSQKVSAKVSSSTKQNILGNIFAISRDPTQFTLMQATTGRFGETTEHKSIKKSKDKPRFINFVEDGSDLKNAKFCRLNINSILHKYDIKKAKLKAKLRKMNQKRSLSPTVNESQKMESKSKNHSLNQSIAVSSHRRSFDAASIQSLLRRQQQYEDPIVRRIREQEEQKSQLIMDKQATLQIMDYCSKALSNDIMNDIKVFQALFMLDGTRIFNIKEIPEDCGVLVLSEHQNVFLGLHNTGPDLSGNEAYSLELRAMFKTVKQRWIQQKEEEYMREAQEHFNLNTPQLLIQENRTQTSLGFHQRTQSPFLFQKHSLARQRKISPIRISKGRIKPIRTHYPSQKHQEERVTLPSIEEIPGGDDIPRFTHTSMTLSEPMMAEIVIKQEEKEERKQSQKRDESTLPVISKRDQKYLNSEARIINHKKKIQMRKNLRSVANLSLPTQPSVLSTSSQSGVKNLAYSEIKDHTKKYKLQTRDIYDLYSRFKSIKGLYEDVTGGGIDGQQGKERIFHEEDGVSVLFLMKDSPIFKGKMIHISSRILRALGFDPDNKKAIVTWDKFLYINSLLRYFSLDTQEYVSFWGKFLDPDSFQRIKLKEIRSIFQNLARGVYNTEETIISASCADAIVELIQMSGCVEQERVNTTGQKVSKRQTLSTAQHGSQITDYSISRLSSAHHEENHIEEPEQDKYEEYLNITYFKECLRAGHLDPMVLNHLVLDRYDNCFTCIEYNKRVLKNKRREIRKQRRTQAEEKEPMNPIQEGQLDLSLLEDIRDMLGDLKLE